MRVCVRVHVHTSKEMAGPQTHPVTQHWLRRWAALRLGVGRRPSTPRVGWAGVAAVSTRGQSQLCTCPRRVLPGTTVFLFSVRVGRGYEMLVDGSSTLIWKQLNCMLLFFLLILILFLDTAVEVNNSYTLLLK